jgi:hypothetical protein
MAEPASPEHLDELRHELIDLVDHLTLEERVEVGEHLGGRREPSLPPGGNATAVLGLLASAERDEQKGELPPGSARTLREVLARRLA